jgi:hypothetical protein
MSLPIRWLGASVLGSLTLLGAAAPRANAQLSRGGTPVNIPSLASQSINPIFRVGPNLTLPQAAYNTSVMGQAARNVPPYALGYNPYPQVANYGGAGYGGLGYGGAAYGGGGYGGASLAASPYSYGAAALGGYGGATLSTSPYGASPYGGATLDSGVGSPYGGGYGTGGYGEDPYAGYLRGAADVTNAQGRYLIQTQQARLMQTQADLSKLDFRRRVLEEAAIERKNWLNPEAERVKDMQAAYNRATREPPITEVLSGLALNDLYNHAYKLQEEGKTLAPRVMGPDVNLEEDLLKQINLTGNGSGGSIGLLKERGRLTWPLVLQSPEYEKARTRLTTLAADAVQQVRLNNPVSTATLRDMSGDLRRLNETLLHNVGEISPSEYVEAKRYLNALDSAIKALSDPNVGNQLNQSWAARGKTVAELVNFMTEKGLKFAPATAGDEPAYRSLYQRFVIYDAGLSTRMASANTSTNTKRD